MRKVIKILLRIVSAIALLLIIIPILGALLLSIPFVQNAIAGKASEFASEKLGTRVEIGHITIGLLNRVSVRDFYVEDLDGDTLLYVNHVNAYFSSLATLPKQLTINYGHVEGGKFFLRETTRGPMNVKEVTDRIPRGNGKNKFCLKIRSLSGNNIDFIMHRLAKSKNDGGVDYTNMQFLGIDVQIDDFMVEQSAVSGDVQSLSFVERSGFTLDKLSGRFFVDKGKIKVEESEIISSATDINLKYLLISGENWQEYKDFINKVSINCRVENSTVSSDDVGYFAPTMWQWQTVISDADLEMNGPVANFRAEAKRLTTKEGGSIVASARVKGLVDVPRTHFDINIKEIDAPTEEITTLLHNIAHININEKALSYISRTERISASGRFSGTINDFRAKADVKVGSGGNVKAECTMRKQGDKRHFTASTNIGSINLGYLLQNRNFDTASLTANAEGDFGGGGFSMQGASDISDIHLFGHNYKELAVKANIVDKRIIGNLATNDSALKMEGEAIADFSEAGTPRYDAIISIERADLHAMCINPRDSISLLKGDIGVSLQGSTIDDMQGSVRIADAEYQTINNECNADLVEVTLTSDEDSRTITLESDFADATFESRTKYSKVIYYLKDLLAQYAPQLYDKQTREKIDRHIEEIGDEVAMLAVSTKELDPLLGCITEGLEVAEGSSLQMLVNPADNRFLMRAKSDFVMHRNYLATELDLKAGNAGDSLALSLEANDLYAGMLHFSKVGVSGGAKNNRLHLDGHFSDSLRNMNGELSATMLVSRNNGARHFSIGLNPTHIRQGDDIWDISTEGIEIDSSRIVVRNFAVQNESQGLFVDGVASRMESDSIHLRLDNFSLAPITQITSRIGYEIDGTTDGYATVHSALKQSRIDARINLNDVSVSGIAVPNLLLTSQWDFGRSRASLNISTVDTKKSVIQGFYAPAQMRYYAHLHTDNINMALLDPMLKGIISETKGSATADLTLTGVRREAELSGKITATGLSTKVDYLNCRFTAPEAVMIVKNNKMLASKIPIYDEYNRRGDLSIGLSLQHLSNIEYNIDLQANNMLIMNTTARDNPMFYGTVFASGTGSIRGDKAGVQMDFVARSEDNTKFFMPLTDKSDIQSADFVTFATQNNIDTTSYLVRKKMFFENRQKRRTAGGGAMDITMALDVRPNAEMQLVIDPTVGDIIKGRGEGLLNMRINPKANIFEMYGDVTIESGSYLFTLQNIINKWFDIEPGSTIQWTGDPLDAMLNIDAVYKLKASLQPLVEGSISGGNVSSRAVPVECYIHLKDRLMQPTVTFDVVVPDADSEVQSIIASTLATPESKSQQFLYLIIANSFVSESSSMTAATGATSAAATTGFEMLSNQLSNWLSNDNYKIVLRYRPRTAQMSDEVDFGFSKGLINNRLIIEVEGNYIVDKTQVVNATSNFTGEAYLTWLIDRAGMLRLKGFTHTIDRFDENQGLQETGLGIYFKEDFENGRNLQQRVASRFKREKKERQVKGAHTKEGATEEKGDKNENRNNK